MAPPHHPPYLKGAGGGGSHTSIYSVFQRQKGKWNPKRNSRGHPSPNSIFKGVLKGGGLIPPESYAKCAERRKRRFGSAFLLLVRFQKDPHPLGVTKHMFHTPVAWTSFRLRVFVLHPGITPLGNEPEWFNITRLYPEMCLNGANTQWVYSQSVIQNPLDFGTSRSSRS